MIAVQPLGRDDPAYGHFVSALREAGLSVDDLDAGSRFFGLLSDADPNAFGGLEGSGPDQLVRSVVVPHSARGRGFGRRMVDALVGQARVDGAARLWLLTTSAEGFFADLGWAVVERAVAPDAVRVNPQFARLCPASAVLMCRQLA